MREIKFKSYVREYDNVIRSYIWEPFEPYPQESDNILKGELLCSRLQFTGLKDKNGKEIYEGDIVQRGVIVFANGKFQGQYYGSDGEMYELWEDDLCQERNIEVLGNIFENPELLNG